MANRGRCLRKQPALFKKLAMKKILLILFVTLSLQSSAQFPIAAIIQAGIKKVIVAVDLKIQKLQNKTIWLQNAQKTIENKMSKLKLTEIQDWVNKQKELYQNYFDELKKIKTAITYYHRVKDIIDDQGAMVKEYKAAWALFRSDRNFTPEEIRFMAGVYEGMLNEAVRNLEPLFLVVNAFATQMSDAKRMEIIDQAAAQLEATFLDLKAFNNQNKARSLQRAYEMGEIEYTRRLYGL